MAEILSVSINIDKVDMTKIYNGAKGRYLNLTVAVNDTKDQFDQDVQVWQEQSKEERDAKVDRNFLGGGKKLWTGQQQGQ